MPFTCWRKLIPFILLLHVLTKCCDFALDSVHIDKSYPHGYCCQVKDFLKGHAALFVCGQYHRSKAFVILRDVGWKIANKSHVLAMQQIH